MHLLGSLHLLVPDFGLHRLILKVLHGLAIWRGCPHVVGGLKSLGIVHFERIGWQELAIVNLNRMFFAPVGIVLIYWLVKLKRHSRESAIPLLPLSLLQFKHAFLVSQLKRAVLGHSDLLVTSALHICVVHNLFCAGCLNKGLNLAQTERRV